MNTVPHESLHTMELTRIRLALNSVAIDAAADHNHDREIRQVRSPVSATIRANARALSGRATVSPSRPVATDPSAIMAGKSGGKLVSGCACWPVKSAGGGSLYDG